MAERPATTTRKKPGRKRRVAGWVLLVLGVLITGVWGGSRWWQVCWSDDMTTVSTWKGFLYLALHPYPMQAGAGWQVGREDRRSSPVETIKLLDDTVRKLGEPRDSAIDAGVFGYYRVFKSTRIFLPLWPFALISLLGGGWLVWSGRRARRRAMTGVCLKCGYDLAGLATPTAPTPPCPECGTVAQAAPHPPR
ncbi:MAG: hypothetical protein ACREJO_14815 [Phycisphaerales bacterium]